MSEAVFYRIRALLEQCDSSYRVVDHPETFTSVQSAIARNEPLQNGGKALLMKADGAFVLAVVRADQKLDSRKLQRALGSRKLRFASREELAALTGGLVPGAVPPFGLPVFEFSLYVDEQVTRNDRIAFNAGMLTRSIVMPLTDYLRAANPIVADFSTV